MDGVSQPQAARSQGSSDISSCGSPHHGMPQIKRRRCQVWPEPAAVSAGRQEADKKGRVTKDESEAAPELLGRVANLTGLLHC